MTDENDAVLTDSAPTDLARAYYEAIDAGDYDRFADLLAPGVVHERPDRTIEGRETLVGFMRDDRPQKDTSHDIEAVYSDETGTAVAVRGRLRDADGNPMFAFVDTFEFERGSEGDGGGGDHAGKESDSERERITRIETYTN